MMHSRLFFIDLAKNRQGLTDGRFSLPRVGSASDRGYLFGEGELRSRKKANGGREIFGSGKPARAGAEITSGKLVTNLGGT